MSVAIPRERCYYYECSDGRVRLTYFIPPHELEELVAAGNASPALAADFPDGVDLDCTEPDFADFHEQYGYRPEHAATALQNAFFAIFTSTRGWRTFRGTGLIPADALESRVRTVTRAVRRRCRTRKPPCVSRGRSGRAAGAVWKRAVCTRASTGRSGS